MREAFAFETSCAQCPRFHVDLLKRPKSVIRGTRKANPKWEATWSFVTYDVLAHATLIVFATQRERQKRNRCPVRPLNPDPFFNPATRNRKK